MTRLLISTAIAAIVSTSALTACLQTRQEVRKDPVVITPQQRKAADENVRKDEIDKDFRELYGKIETLENQVAQLKDSERVRALEMKNAQLEGKLSLLEATVTELHTKNKKEVAAVKDTEESLLSEADKLFDDKKWEDAVLAYEEYRKKYPKGKHYTEATYKIGQCFQSLGLKDDAKIFFKEVVEKYPKSKEASLAKSKLKKL